MEENPEEDTQMRSVFENETSPFPQSALVKEEYLFELGAVPFRPRQGKVKGKRVIQLNLLLPYSLLYSIATC
jgi:hypothetical protein